MDNDLLEKEKVVGPSSADRMPMSANSEEETPEYNDLKIEPRKPPVRVKFDPPIEYDGQSYRELVFDFDAMTGKDFIRAEREFTRLYKADRNEMPLPELKHLYHDIILAHRANVSYLLIQKLERRYYVPLRTEALKACGSTPDEERA